MASSRHPRSLNRVVYHRQEWFDGVVEVVEGLVSRLAMEERLVSVWNSLVEGMEQLSCPTDSGDGIDQQQV
jgi:hypothetical protein